MLPAARFVLCGDDGRVAPSGRIPAQGSVRAQAWAGFEWGEHWSASVGPLLGCAGFLGERLPVLGQDALEPDADVLSFPELAAEFALGALEEGDLERAGAVLARRSEQGPAGARLELVRGRLALARGDRARAVAAWLAAVELDPEAAELLARVEHQAWSARGA